MTMMNMNHITKVPAPPPAWVQVFMTSAQDESLDAVLVSTRAILVAGEIVPASLNRALWLHRFAAALDRDTSLLYALERQVSPQAPIEESHRRINARIERILAGGTGA